MKAKYRVIGWNTPNGKRKTIKKGTFDGDIDSLYEKILESISGVKFFYVEMHDGKQFIRSKTFREEEK